jgi:UDP-N-acetylglucosamine 2-epimerase (non-hydrolysing)
VNITAAGLQFLPPFGFFDFVRLERGAFCILSDSGTVQEEASLLNVPNVTIRDVTERPETLECGSNFLSGVDPDSIVTAVRFVTRHDASWVPPREYLAEKVAEAVCRIVTGYRLPDAAEISWRFGASVAG